MPVVNPERWLEDVDAILNRLERDAIKRLLNGFAGAERSLLNELRHWYAFNSGSLPVSLGAREEIARAFLQQIQLLLNVVTPEQQAALSSLTADATLEGVDAAQTLLSRYGEKLPTIRPPLEAAASAAKNAFSRLEIHGQAFATKASQIIVSNIVSGAGIQKTASELKAALGITARAAKTIARTESISALDGGKQQQYKAAGVEYVQRLATLDTRVCRYCAARHGNVYELGTPAVLHPNDRCVMIPFKFEWLEAGLIDLEFLQSSRAKVFARAMQNPTRGAAPFEQAARAAPPKVHWSIPN